MPSINLTQFEIDPAVIKLIPAETAQKYQILPLSRPGATLTIAMTDPTNVFAMDDIKFMTGYNVEPVVASETAVSDAITQYYSLAAKAAATAAPARIERARNGGEVDRRNVGRRRAKMSKSSRRWRKSAPSHWSGRGARRRSSSW